jgi:hypothetical protein
MELDIAAPRRPILEISDAGNGIEKVELTVNILDRTPYRDYEPTERLAFQAQLLGRGAREYDSEAVTMVRFFQPIHRWHFQCRPVPRRPFGAGLDFDCNWEPLREDVVEMPFQEQIDYGIQIDVNGHATLLVDRRRLDAAKPISLPPPFPHPPDSLDVIFAAVQIIDLDASPADQVVARLRSNSQLGYFGEPRLRSHVA